MSGSFLVLTLLDAKFSDIMSTLCRPITLCRHINIMSAHHIVSAHHPAEFSFQILITMRIGAYIQNFKRKFRPMMGRGQPAKLGILVQTLVYT